jgi:DNA-binding transcriptional MerR regulator
VNAKSPVTDPLLNTRAAAPALDLRPQTLRTYAKLGLIDSIRLRGYQYRYNVAKFLRDNRTQVQKSSRGK